MHNFSLIKQLEKGEEPKKPNHGIHYHQYELVVEGKTEVVNVPKREALLFEDAVADLTTKITRHDLRKLLRTFRGTRS